MVRTSRNLNNRIQLLKADINRLLVLKANNKLDRAGVEQIRDVYKQLTICKQLLRDEKLKAPIKELL